MKPFFIIGFPRSRTAWFANLFSTESIFCFHDLFVPRLLRGENLDPETIREILMAVGKQYVGISQPGQCFYDIMKKSYPNAPIVLIQRPMEESYSAVLKAFNVSKGDDQDREGLNIFFKASENAIEAIKQDPCTLVEDFHSLDMNALKRIWQHCTPDLEFDEFRARQLQELRVIIKCKSIPGLYAWAERREIVIGNTVSV